MILIYVFDTNVFIVLLDYYYKSVFPTLWDNFEKYEELGLITSTREVRRELEKGSKETQNWVKDHLYLFPSPTRNEASFVSSIYEIRHFQQNIEKKKQLKGGEVADPFVVARAAVIEGTVVTLEKGSAHGAKIPDICHKFDVKCLDLEGFMDKEKWSF